MASISVIGAGYVGLVTAACLAELGHTVTGLEVDETRLAMLRRGELPIFEPGLGKLFAKHFGSGRLRFESDYAAAIPESEFVFVAVNTPCREDGSADTQFVTSAVRMVLAHARPGLIIILKSTVPVGTADELAMLTAPADVPGVEIVSNPEFLREGSAVADFLQPDRIVVGAEHEAVGDRVAALFDGINAPVMRCSRRAAELAKYTSNALLAARISFMNEIAGLAATLGADVGDVARIVGADRRIGPSFLNAGLGWGGSCFPKDIRALVATAANQGVATPILRAVIDVNSHQRELAFQHLRAAVGGRPGATIGVLGLSFKPGTDDIRESPALDVIGRLIEEGIHVRAHDPAAMPNARRVLPVISFCECAAEVADGADALLLATEWPEYLSLDWEDLRTRMRGTIVVDGRRVLDPAHLTALGLTYVSLGDALDRSTTSLRHRVHR
jgi:UDPglucose 6-dehydrogenase